MSSRERRVLALVIVPLVLAIAWAHHQVPLIATGDGYASYFPVVWDLLDGRGSAAFDNLAYGPFRMPGYPLLLFALTATSGDLAFAVSAATCLAAVVALGATGLLGARLTGPLVAPLAVVFVAASPSFLHMCVASTPDMACFALVMSALVLTTRESPSPRLAFAAGLCAGLAALFRLNSLPIGAVLIASLALLRGEPRAQRTMFGACGLLVPLAGWFGFELATIGRLYAETRVLSPELGWPMFEPSLGLGGEDTLAIAGRVTERLLFSGPWAIARRVGLWPVSLLALLSIPWLRALPRRPAFLLVLVALGSWLVMGLAYLEARYYPLLVVALAIAACVTVDRVLVRFVPAPRTRSLVVLACAVALCIARHPALDRALEGQRIGGHFIEQSRALAREASTFGDGPIGSQEVAYRLSPFRLALRELGDKPLVCCGEREDLSGFLEFVGHGTIHPGEQPERWELRETVDPSPHLRLFRRR